MMNEREALNLTIKVFGLRAIDLAKTAGMGQNELSRYRNGHSDMLGARIFAVIKALPKQAQIYFWSILTSEVEVTTPLADLDAEIIHANKAVLHMQSLPLVAQYYFWASFTSDLAKQQFPIPAPIPEKTPLNGRGRLQNDFTEFLTV